MFRSLGIALEILRFALSSTLRSVHLLPGHPGAPERLRSALVRLGTTFIKFGQALGMRHDMLPEDYIAALQSLQDHIAPFPAEEAVREFEQELGRPIEDLFEYFRPRTVCSRLLRFTLHASAMAVTSSLKCADLASRGASIAICALAWLARIASGLAPKLKHYQPLRIIDEIWGNLRKEIDFRREAQSIRRFSAAFSGWPTVHIPAVIDDFVSESVIVQEKSGGRRIDDPAIAPDGPRLAQNFVDAYLHQIFVLGVFHGDPHSGICSSPRTVGSAFMTSVWSSFSTVPHAASWPPLRMPSCARMPIGW